MFHAVGDHSDPFGAENVLSNAGQYDPSKSMRHAGRQCQGDLGSHGEADDVDTFVALEGPCGVGRDVCVSGGIVWRSCVPVPKQVYRVGIEAAVPELLVPMKRSPGGSG